MLSYQSTWQCDATNRKVEVLVNYSLAGSTVAINSVTPTKVTFLCPETKSELRSIGVWTEAGRQHLVEVLHNAGHLGSVEQEIASNHALELGA